MTILRNGSLLSTISKLHNLLEMRWLSAKTADIRKMQNKTCQSGNYGIIYPQFHYYVGLIEVWQ